MDRELRHVVTRKLAGRLAVGVLAEAVVEAILTRRDGGRGDRTLEPEAAQRARRVRRYVDADTDGLEFRRRFKDTAGGAGTVEHQTPRQSANGSADNQNFHDVEPLLRILGPAPPRERGLQAPAGNSREEQGYQNIIAGERDVEETPRRFVAANDADVFKLTEQISGRSKTVDRSRTIIRARPELPLDAGVIGRQSGVPQHDCGDN